MGAEEYILPHTQTFDNYWAFKGGFDQQFIEKTHIGKDLDTFKLLWASPKYFALKEKLNLQKKCQPINRTRAYFRAWWDFLKQESNTLKKAKPEKITQ